MLVSYSGTHGKDILSFLDESRRRRLFEDVKIICEDSVVLWGHAAVLGSVSPLLKGLLSESSESPHSLLLLPDVKSAHMKKALEALYRGSVTLQRSSLKPILDILGFLQCEAPLTEPKKEKNANSSNEGIFVQALGEDSNLHKCVMCSKTFLHAQNLKIHLQSHLGLQVQLNKCVVCKRVFGRSLEYELHLSSHRHWQKLRLRGVSPLSISSPVSKFRSKAVKRSISVLLRVHRLRNPPPATRVPPPEQQSHEDDDDDAAPAPPAKKMLKLKIKNNNPSSSDSSPSKEHSAESTWCNICRRFYADLRGLKKHYSRIHSSQTPPAPLEQRRNSKTPNGGGSRGSPLSNRDLTCPTCDKVFVAYSIFQRHLQTAHHGSSSESSKGTPPPPHMNKVLQPTILLRGRETPKYECHLCKQVFLRVKDLAKHRAKMCSAWVN